jgi:hypothetical protein
MKPGDIQEFITIICSFPERPDLDKSFKIDLNSAVLRGSKERCKGMQLLNFA